MLLLLISSTNNTGKKQIKPHLSYSLESSVDRSGDPTGRCYHYLGFFTDVAPVPHHQDYWQVQNHRTDVHCEITVCWLLHSARTSFQSAGFRGLLVLAPVRTPVPLMPKVLYARSRQVCRISVCGDAGTFTRVMPVIIIT